jgi:uncharacterized protein YjbI with pentapeptide repeats
MANALHYGDNLEILKEPLAVLLRAPTADRETNILVPGGRPGGTGCAHSNQTSGQAEHPGYHRNEGRRSEGLAPMADDEQLAVLRQGSGAWNGWRRRNSDVRVNLTGTDVVGRHLRSVNLSAANLVGANLAEANASQALLSGADLSEAVLDGADLTGAKL